MSEGTSQTDGTFMVGDNGQAANEQIVTRMSKTTKEQIEAEFQSLGIPDWQEFMAHLINQRQRVFMPQSAPQVTAFAEKSVVQKPSKINWWIVGSICVLVVGMIAFLLKKRGAIPSISFK